eukprot:1944575-Amphidinium_carterae.1
MSADPMPGPALGGPPTLSSWPARFGILFHRWQCHGSLQEGTASCQLGRSTNLGIRGCHFCPQRACTL